MVKRDPFDVLGVQPGASPHQIKAAWRKLARRHHPDLTGDDPEASRIATRQMAEINEAYAALTRGGGAASGRSRAGWTDHGQQAEATAARGSGRGGGPPRPRPTRPVTARLDLSGTVRPRNAPLRAAGPAGSGGLDGGARASGRGRPPIRRTETDREPPRASTPTGPLERGRVRGFRRPPGPPLAEALEHELEFGKFRGHTLGQVADFEPSYIDWLAKTITRDREMLAAARVVREDLDRRGIARRERTVDRDASRSVRPA